MDNDITFDGNNRKAPRRCPRLLEAEQRATAAAAATADHDSDDSLEMEDDSWRDDDISDFEDDPEELYLGNYDFENDSNDPYDNEKDDDDKEEENDDMVGVSRKERLAIAEMVKEIKNDVKNYFGYFAMYVQSNNYVDPVGQALMSQQNITKLYIHMTEETNLTITGAKRLLNYLRQSPHVEEVEFEETDLDLLSKQPRIWQFMAIESVTTFAHVRIASPLDYKNGYRLGKKLVQSRGERRLQYLDLRIASCMSVSAAWQLALGLQDSGIQTLDLTIADVDDLDDSTDGCNSGLHIVVCFAVMNIPEVLIHADITISTGVSDDEAIPLGDALMGNNILKHFFVSFSDLSAVGARAIAQGLKHSNIEDLQICWPEEEMLEQDDVMNILYEEGVLPLSSVKKLYIRYGKGNTTASLALLLPKLTSFELELCTPMKVAELIPGLRGSVNLSVLILDDCMTAREMIDLAYHLSFAPLLTLLHVTGNLTCEEGDRLLARNGFLDIELSDVVSGKTNIRPLAAEQLMLAVSSHPNLVNLNLYNSVDIGMLGLKMIGRLLPNVRLRTIGLRFKDFYREQVENLYGSQDDDSDSDFDDDDNSNLDHADSIPEIDKAFINQACQALLTGLSSNHSLQELHFDILKCCRCVAMEERINFHLNFNKTWGPRLCMDLLLGEWCHVLAKNIQQQELSIVMLLLRNLPMLFAHHRMNC